MNTFPLSRTARWCAISLLVGIACSEWFEMPLVWIIGLCWIGVMLCVHRRILILSILGWCLIGWLCGMLVGISSIPVMPGNNIGVFNGTHSRQWEGVIVEEPDIRQTQQKIVVNIDSYRDGDTRYSGRVLIEAPVYPWFSYGDRVQLKCAFVEPFETANYSYKAYLSRRGIFSWCRNPNAMIILQHSDHYSILGVLFSLKQWMIGNINAVLPEPHSTLLAGILFGARSGFPTDVAKDFSLVGLTHIVAVSGYNITLVMVALSGLCTVIGVGRKRATWVVIIGITLFTLFAGGASSAVRAALMGIVVLVARHMGRSTAIGHTLIMVATGMVVVSPPMLLHDVGFQLSFLATLGLVYGAPVIGRVTKVLERWPGIKELVDQTLAAIIATTPLTVATFSSFSVIALLANLAILPVMSIAMIGGFGVMVITFIGTFLGSLSEWWYLFMRPFVWCVWLILEYILKTVHVLAHIPYASLSIFLGEWSWVFFILSSMVLIWIVRFFSPKV